MAAALLKLLLLQQICIASKNASEFIMSCLTLKMVYYVRFVASIFHLFEKVRQAMQQQQQHRQCVVVMEERN